MATTLRRIVGTLLSLLVASGAAVAVTTPAHAEEGFRYWNYFHLDGQSWAFAKTGAADHHPDDGAVEGFRYGTSTPSQGIEPRADLDEVTFEAVCAGTEATEGEKRVAVLIDYGTEEDAGPPPEPRAACAAVAQDASTQQVLEEVAQVRLDAGMLCALDGYPASGCGEPVPNAKISADENPVAFALPSDRDAATSPGATEREQDNTWVPVSIVAALIVVLGAGGVLWNRRTKAA